MKKRPQDWINLIIGIWLFLSPWIFGYAYMGHAWNSFLFGALVTIFSVFALYDRKAWEEWINTFIGIWIFISPWVLGMVINSVMWNHWIIGILIVAMSATSIREAQRQARAETA